MILSTQIYELQKWKGKLRQHINPIVVLLLALIPGIKTLFSLTYLTFYFVIQRHAGQRSTPTVKVRSKITTNYFLPTTIVSFGATFIPVIFFNIYFLLGWAFFTAIPCWILISYLISQGLRPSIESTTVRVLSITLLISSLVFTLLYVLGVYFHIAPLREVINWLIALPIHPRARAGDFS